MKLGSWAESLAATPPVRPGIRVCYQSTTVGCRFQCSRCEDTKDKDCGARPDARAPQRTAVDASSAQMPTIQRTSGAWAVFAHKHPAPEVEAGCSLMRQ